MAKYALLTTLQLDVANFSSGIKSAVKETDNLKTGVNGAAKSITDSFKDISQMGIGQMKRELASLKNISFAGKTKEEITAINLQIGRLMDSMGDLRASQKVMGTEMASVALQGVQAFGAFAEVGFGVATMFGASEEASKKYQQTMVSLIGVMQGLATIQSLVTSGELTAIAARIKNGVVTAALAVKTALVTAAQWAWNVAMTANPIGLIIAGVAALIAGIVLLTKWLTTNTAVTDENSEARKKNREEVIKMKDADEEYADSLRTKSNQAFLEQKTQLDILLIVLRDNTKALDQRQLALKQIIALDPTHLKGLTLANSATAEGINLIKGYTEALQKRVETEGSIEYVKEKWKQYYELKEKQDKASYDRVGKELYLRQKEAEIEEKRKKGEVFSEFYPDNSKNPRIVAKDVEALKTEETALGVQMAWVKERIVETTNEIAKNIVLTEDSTKANKNNNKSLEEKNKILKDIADGKFDFMPNAGNGSIEGLAKYIVSVEAEKNKAIEESNKETEALLADNEEMYSNYYANMAGMKISKALAPFKKANEEIQKQTKVFADSLMNLLGSLTDEIDAAFERFFDKALTPKERKTEFGRGILTAMGEFMSELGKQLIVLGGLAELVQVALATAFSNPVSAGVLIGAGIALIAGGAALKGYAAKGFRQEGFEDGGIVGGTLYSGDQVLARVNSKEMILNQAQQAELFKIANGGSNWGAGEVEFKIKGTELVGVLSNYNRVLQKTR